MVRRLVAAVRTGFALTVVVLSTLVLGTTAWVMAKRNPASPAIDRLTRVWSRLFLGAAGVRYEIEGADRVDPGGSYVVVANHRSNIDIPINFVAVPVPIRYLAKKELFGVPFLGAIMRAVGIVEVDRQARARAHSLINEQLHEVIGLGRSLMIYPEGTRSKDGEMQPFKKGAFRIALDNGLDVVPISISGSREVWAPGSKLIYGGTVTVTVHEPIPVAGLEPPDITDLRDRARNIVEKGFEELRKK